MSGDIIEGKTDMKSADQREKSVPDRTPRIVNSIKETPLYQRAAGIFGAVALAFALTQGEANAQTPPSPGSDKSGEPAEMAADDIDLRISADTVLKTPQPATPRPTSLPTISPTESPKLAVAIPTVTPTPTAEAAPTVTETEVVTYTEVIVLKDANLRSGPGTSFPLVGSAAQDETLNVAFGSDGWAVLEPTDGDVKRFIFGELVKPTVESVSPTDSMGTGGPVSSDTTDGAEAEDPASGLEAPALDGVFHISSLDEVKLIPSDAVAVELEPGTDPEINDILETFDQLGIDDTFYMSSLEGQTTLHVGMQSDLPWMNELFSSNVLSPESMNYILKFLAGMLDKNGKSIDDYSHVVIVVRTNFTPLEQEIYYKGSSTTGDSTVGEQLTDLKNKQSNVAAITSSLTDESGRKFTSATVATTNQSDEVLFFVAMNIVTNPRDIDSILSKKDPVMAAILGIMYAQAAIIDGTPFASSDGGVDGNPTVNTATKLLNQSDEVTQSLEGIVPKLFINDR